MAEHMISHYIDMFAGDKHPGTSHGEQVGVGTVTMSRLHEKVLSHDAPPEFRATVIPEDELRRRFPKEVAENMIEQTALKAMNASAADAMNRRLATEWQTIRHQLLDVMLPHQELLDAMHEAGCQTTAGDLGLEPDFYRDAVRYARYIRDRYSMLDVEDDSVGLDGFIAAMPV